MNWRFLRRRVTGAPAHIAGVAIGKLAEALSQLSNCVDRDNDAIRKLTVRVADLEAEVAKLKVFARKWEDWWGGP